MIHTENTYRDRVVIRPMIARRLLQDGYKIIDLRPQVTNHVKDFSRAVFVFAGQKGLDDRIKELSQIPSYKAN